MWHAEHRSISGGSKLIEHGSLRCLFSQKATFRIIFEQICENTTVKNPETRTSCLKEPTFCQKASS